MTNEQIIKALDLCANTKGCRECPLYSMHSANCIKKLQNESLDLINRQKAEIEKLKDGCGDCPILKAKSDTIYELNEQIEYWQRGYSDLRQSIKTAKSEAIKEFLKEIINNILPQYLYGHEETALRISFALSEKAKEMTEQKGR